MIFIYCCFQHTQVIANVRGANDLSQQDILRLLQLQYSIACPIFCFTVFTSVFLGNGWLCHCANTKFSHKISDHTGGGNASSNPLFRSNVKVLMEFVLVMPNELIVILWPLFFLKNVTAIHNGNNVDILEFELINWKLFNLLNHFNREQLKLKNPIWTF